MTQTNPLMEQHSDMLAMISHDLKSPMNAILGATDFMLHELGDDPVYEETLRIIEKAGQNMLQLIGNIVAMSKMEAGKETVHPDWITDLPAVIEDIINTFSYEARVNDISLTTRISAGLPTVNWDINKIHYHVINNIISNAIRHTPPGGRIMVTAGHESGKIFIRIKDNGPGIPAADRERIFKRFECLDATNQRIHHSNGLGLYNANLFVQQHGGRIRIEDGLDDTGAGFVLTLPINPFVATTQDVHQTLMMQTRNMLGCPTLNEQRRSGMSRFAGQQP